MQRSVLSLFLITVAVIGIVSCSRTDKSGIVVPKDAALAVHINAPSLTSKVSWQEIQQNEWFKKLYAEETDSLSKQLLDDPSNSGIDIKADMAFFIKKQGQGGYMAFEGAVKNTAAFETFAKKLNKGGTVSKSGDINVMATGLKSLVAWNNNRFVYISDASMGGLANRLSGMNNSSPGEPFAYHTDSLQRFAVQLFDLPHKENLLSDDRFASLMKEPGDIHYWVNAEQYYNSLGGALSLLKLNVLFEGNVYATSINFDNGKITLKTKGYYNKELRSLIDKYASSSISTDMLNRIPSQNVVAVFAAKYPPEGFKDMIKLTGVDGFVNSFFSSVGYSTDEFVKATKGDVLLSVSDFNLGAHKTTITGPNGESIPLDQPAMPDAKILFATSVNDKPSFDKLFGILQSKIQENAAEVASKIHFQLNNNWFAAGNAPEQVNGFLAGGNNHFPFADRLSGHAFGGYINVQQILKSTAPAITDSSGKAIMDLSTNMWQDIFMTSGGEKSGAYTGEVEINLVDKNTNSLKQLNKYLDSISKFADHKHGEYNAQINYSDPAALSFAMLAPLAH
jgi:hypothetical protein